jgi:hypothetical protein
MQDQRWTYEFELEVLRNDATLTMSRFVMIQSMMLKLVYHYLGIADLQRVRTQLMHR